MRSITLLLLLALSAPALAAGGASDAMADLQAQDIPVITETGITAFDSVLMKAKAIHDTLDAIQGRVIGAQDRIALAVGLTEGTPIRMTMWELKQRAGGPIEVQMRDSKPYLTVGGTGSQEVQAMIDAANKGALDLAGIPNEVKELVPQVQALVAACQAFPGQLNPQLIQEAGMSPLQLPKVAKTLANDVKAVVATPKRIESLVSAAQDLITGIPQGLAATEPPVVAAPIAAKGKSAKATDDEGLGDPGEADEAPTKAAKADKAEKEPKADKAAKTASASGGADEDLPTSPISAMVDDALASLRDAEVDAAMNLLGEADASLGRLQAPIAAGELQHLYQTVALVHLVDGNASAASASVTQALVVDPEAKPLTELGPDYAKLHKALLKSGVVHVIPVDVNGDGVAYLSGHRVEGGTRIYVAAGKHLLQTDHGGDWTSEVIWVAEGASIDL
ncbi:MAG: hypothetical protein ABMB14_15595 [Myxococcota bacterium]